MKCLIFILAVGLLAQTTIGETAGAISRFDAANAAYARGDFNQAQMLYGQMIDDGEVSAELFYNAGNTAFRRGFAGQAILWYRRAWYLAPRDADIRANMQLARQRAGSITPAVSLFQRAAQELSHVEWTRLFKIAFWSAVTLTALSIVIPAIRRFTTLPATLAAAVALVSLLGWLHWRQWLMKTEVVVIRSGETARYEPRNESTAHFATPEGSILEREENFDEWVKVRDDARAGWLPADAVQLVYPWNNSRTALVVFPAK